MSTRSKRINEPPALADLESATNPVEIPGPMPPPGTPARVRQTIDYDIHVNPNQRETDAYSDELRRLAGEEEENLPLPEPPSDPLSEFCHVWQNYVGYSLRVTRLPDPANKRVPGQTYNNTCFEITALGCIPFDPNNIVPQLQLINGNSGGALRLFLSDENGIQVPGARVDRILIPDPPKAFREDPRQFNPNGYNPYGEMQYRREPQPAPQPPQKSETEIYIEQMQRELFQKVMMRALDPPALPTPDPLSTLSPDDRLALGLLQRGDILESAVNRIASLAQAPDRIESATWKDKLADASIQLVTHNPQIIATVTDIISRATVALATAFAPRANGAQIAAEPIVIPPPPQQIQRAPAHTPVPPTMPRALDGLPETPQPEDEDEDIEIELMEEVIKLLLSEKPLRLDSPVILDIQEDYATIFNAAMTGLASMPTLMVIQYLCSKSDFCADQFNSERNGAYLKQRLEEFKSLFITQPPQPQPNAAPVTTNETTETAT